MLTLTKEASYHRMVRLAVLQLTCQADLTHNLYQCTTLIKQSQLAGAQLIFTPENTSRLTSLTWPLDYDKDTFTEGEHPSLAAYQTLARECQVTLAIGSIPVRADATKASLSSVALHRPESNKNRRKLVNRSFVISRTGNVIARYDKIHLFDAAVDGGYQESARVQAGHQAVVLHTKHYNLGLSICYDVRFPLLYRELAMAGAEIIAVPSAFTVPTGKAHWHALLRARAIETGCFVVASAQFGHHPGDRITYGHSLIVSPHGEILREMKDEESMFVIDIDLDECRKARGRIPSLQNQSTFTLTTVVAEEC